ncbi:hypothetical protein J6TS7_55970 [Paenibacillus dendritiformis]|uniref:ImmA/IrrE family metallo-endopeptidase n=1 Tax=Paenibacillus TaxID=44249 RepID=UPI001B261AB0|nr:ImmA/IrrE family metallo-endopeptidase [Paenibacillus dendritiformis]MEB9897126.1 ImmA/IrrE family metallo-endopeptidase [Bacillus cereus]GIO81987.1 hypothetical protein J6TS7_55970 [Paenibacillus dendritiformis]
MKKDDEIIKKIVQTYGTNNPFRIAAQKNIPVIYDDLGNIMGYTQTYKRVPMIHINDQLSDFMSTFTCAHELGHRILHPKINTPFLRKKTLFSVDKIEREANNFAVRLLVGSEANEPGETTEHFLLRCGIPHFLHQFY